MQKWIMQDDIFHNISAIKFLNILRKILDCFYSLFVYVCVICTKPVVSSNMTQLEAVLPRNAVLYFVSLCPAGLEEGGTWLYFVSC